MTLFVYDPSPSFKYDSFAYHPWPQNLHMQSQECLWEWFFLCHLEDFIKMHWTAPMPIGVHSNAKNPKGTLVAWLSVFYLFTLYEYEGPTIYISGGWTFYVKWSLMKWSIMPVTTQSSKLSVNSSVLLWHTLRAGWYTLEIIIYY